jgi:ABC-type Fe3+ transport system permease subunit
MDNHFIPIRQAAAKTRVSYHRLWRLIITKRVAARRVRKASGRQTVWLISLPSARKALANPFVSTDLEIVENVEPING